MRDQLGVTAMHTVEYTDGEYTPAPVRGNLVLAAPPLHARKPTAPSGLPGDPEGQTPAMVSGNTPNQAWVA
ncbi:hypothetical protein MTY59_52700 [Mycobacterium senriense]|uniref:Uncharacterized protein n=1 Tax=Mycobacterium senriense TaxID=2775496 RepID=A0ABN6INH3_9MYCO|nr:hypothetical protein MTY59_52700 [Mycobacterium senriense]